MAPHWVSWTDDEIEFLKSSYPDKRIPRAEIESSLPIRNWQSIVVKARSLGLLRRRYRYTVFSDYFDEIDSSSKAYALGLMVSDGWVVRDKHAIGISLAVKDRQLVEWLANQLGENINLRTVSRDNGSDQLCLKISDEHMHSMLGTYGIVPSKSLISVWPERLMKKWYLPFIVGLFDGDGTLVWMKNPSHLAGGTWFWSITGTKSLLDNVAMNLFEITDVQFPPTCQVHSNAWRIGVAGTKAVAIDEAICSLDLPIGLSRKRIHGHPHTLLSQEHDQTTI